ncbi:hypothetical protein BB560_005951, partial [Smittium megazygosporum]
DPSPVIIKNYELSSNSNLLDYLDEFKRADYVCKYTSSKSDFNLGKPHLHFFSSLPDKAFSKHKLEKKTFYKKWSNKDYFMGYKVGYTITSFLHATAPNTLQEIQHIINEKISEDNELFLESAIRRYYGETAKNDPDFCKAVEQLLNQSLSYGEKCINQLLKFRKLNYKNGRDYLRDFVIKGKFQELNKNTFDENECITSVLLQNQEELGIPNDIFYTSLPNHFYLYVFNIGNQLANFFIDVSLNPNVFKKLEHEQREIMKMYGNEITINLLDKMIYLDAAITETIRFGSSIMSMKQASCNIYLPNGVLVSKGSLTKFNVLSYNRSSDIFLNLQHDYIPERHIKLGTKLDEASKTNLAWGLGRQCPYKKYVSVFMKLFTSTIIRSYEVSQRNENNEIEHDGYFFGQKPYVKESLRLAPDIVARVETIEQGFDCFVTF